MELTKGEELNSNRKESLLLSHNGPSTNDLHSIQCTSDVRMEDADKCNHFSIRGYVAEVRKRDVKLCWPLSVPQDIATQVLADSLPPLDISKFKLWSCRNCVQSITGDVIRDTEVMRENELNANDSLITANAISDNLLYGYNKKSADKDLGERAVEAYSSSIANNGENSQDLPCSEKISVKNVTEEGSQICTSGRLRSQENQRQSVNHATENRKSLQAEESLMTKGKTDRRKDHDISLHGTDSHLLACAGQNGRHSTAEYKSGELSNRTLSCEKECKEDNNGFRTNCKRKSLSNDEIQESGKIVSVDMKTSNKDVVAMGVAFNHEQVDRVQISENTAPSNINLFVDLIGKQDNETEVGLFNRKPVHKKARKKRSLEDILKSDESYISKKVKVLNGEAGFIETKRKHELLCGSELKAQYSGSKDLVAVSQNSEAQLTEGALNISTVYQSKEEEPSLMHWLKELSKKAKIDTENTEINPIEKGTRTSLGTSTQKGSEGLGKSMIKRQNDFFQANSQAKCVMLQPDNMDSEDKLINFIHPKNAPLKVRFKFCKSNQSLGGLECSNHQQTNFSKEEKKVPQFKIQNPYKRYLSNKEVTEKQKETSMSGTENEDDIPMDIVEHLAKNQHERHQTTTKVASASSKWTIPLVNENLENEKSCTAGNRETDIQNTLNRSQHFINDVGQCLHNATRNQDPECVLEAVKLKEQQKYNLHIDLNKQDTDFQKTPDCSGHQYLRAQIPASDSSKLFYPPALEVNPQSIKFRESGQVVSSQTLNRSCYSGFPPLAFGCNKVDYGSHHYVKTNPGVVYQERNQMALGLWSDEAVNPIGSRFLNVGVRAVPLANRGNLSSGPLMINQDLCYPKPVALTGSCSNETLSATHLLRLANQAALSRGSLDSNRMSNINQNYYPQTSGVPMLRRDFSNQESIKGPWDARFLHQDKNLGVSSKPHRPVPRLGILGPFLQKEIMTNSSTYRTPLGIEPVRSSELLPPQTNGMEKAGSTFLFNHFLQGNMHPAVIKERSTKHVVPADNHSIFRSSSSCYDIGQVDTSKMENADQSVQHSCMTEKCVVNRNPADFTIIDENNNYMREN